MMINKDVFEKNNLNEIELSQRIEDLLVERNLRGMKDLQGKLSAGYCFRAAKILQGLTGTVLIGTGFPVNDTFETDGPVGALILYKTLEVLGATPVLVCDKPMANAFQEDYRICVISVADFPSPKLSRVNLSKDMPFKDTTSLDKESLGLSEAKRALAHYQPQAIVSIERPGLAADNRYYNMRGEDISARTACFDFFITTSTCPTIAIGDGGNEIGMGNVQAHLSALEVTPAIIPSVTRCDELIISDVSNWGVYGILAFFSLWNHRDFLAQTCPKQVLKYVTDLGGIDGVTRKNELTEDSLPIAQCTALITSIRVLIGFPID